ARDIEIIKKELPIDILEFFCLTPLPGSEDHKKLHAAGVDLDPDLNKYDLEHACTDHPRMSRQRWTEVYKDAFARYYTDEHVEKIMRRAVAGGLQTSKLVTLLAIFSSCVRIEGVHPLQFGVVRRKSRVQRRYGMPLVHPLIFYPWRAYDFSTAMAKWGLIFWRYYCMMKRIKKNPAAKSYSDEAMRLPSDSDETDKIVELFADKIPHTHGAPVRATVGRQAT
ncbi:MAG TPA: radical SAM protein, partial [Xanthobacteraceae bacterium]|nr:radical SAM protein [Xanthobacteraceae bacterium]